MLATDQKTSGDPHLGRDPSFENRCLRPYLFIMCTKTFTTLIKFNSNICGITVGDIQIKISQYADSTVITRDGSFDSGLKVNLG